MKVERAVCPYCGAPINVSRGKNIDTCEYCGMQFVIEGLDHAEPVASDREDMKEHDPEPERRPEEPRPVQPAEAKGLDYWMPVGYRSRKIWKIVLASFYYLAIIGNLLDNDGEHGLAYRIAVSLLLFFIAAIPFSWKPLADTLPGMKTEDAKIRRLCKAGYIFLIMVILGQYL